MKKVVLLTVFAILFNFSLFFLSKYSFPYKGFFPYKGVAKEYSKNFLSKTANFDGVHYLKIAKSGYDQYEQAFFPLYPLIIKFLSPFFSGNLLYAAILLSNLSLILGTIFFYKTIRSLLKEKQAFWALIFFLSFPTGFYLSSIYTEALFFMLFFAGFYFLQKNRVYPSFLSFYLLGLTRVVGVLSIPAIILTEKGKKKGFFLSLAPLLGLLTYMLYLYKTTGDPLFFFTSQPAFGANRSTHLILLPQVFYRYFKIFIFSNISFVYFTAVLEFSFFILIFTLLLFYGWKLFKKNLWGFESGIWFFSFTSLIIPTLTGTLSSIPRYGLLCFSIFIFLAKIKNTYLKLIITLFFLTLKTILTFLFAQGYFVS